MLIQAITKGIINEANSISSLSQSFCTTGSPADRDKPTDTTGHTATRQELRALGGSETPRTSTIFRTQKFHFRLLITPTTITVTNHPGSPRRSALYAVQSRNMLVWPHGSLAEMFLG
jgi:hypothetical protein